MTAPWLSIRVELVEGRGQRLWPRPGRIFAAAGEHTFAQLAEAIDDAFARWDRAHLHAFDLAEGLLITPLDWWDELPQAAEVLDARETTLDRLRPGEQFAYEFDFGDAWNHLCSVASQRIDPLQTLGIAPERPLPYWGWGDIPDPYGRRWDGDDGECDPPADPGLADLPPLKPMWATEIRW
jgi:hypothetical protein